MKLNKKFNLKISLIRTSLIYGDIGFNEDKNLSLIINLMRKFIFLPIPRETGIRQPIHYSQLIKSILKISHSYINNSESKKGQFNIIDIGGDEELTYEKMLQRIKENMEFDYLLRKCFLIKIPNRIFFLILSPVILISPKYYESILRISINMGGFKPVYKISGEKKSKFPVIIKK